MIIKRLLLASLATFLLINVPFVEAQTTITNNTTRSPFSDIEQHTAQREIVALYNAGVIKSTEDALFRPDEPISKAELTELFLAAKGFTPDQVSQSHFADIPTDHWFLPYAETAYRLGLINGINEQGQLFFHPNETVQRQELVAILLRAKGVSGEVMQFPATELTPTLGLYVDRTQIEQWNQRSIAYALKNNIISPDQDVLLQPQQAVTRAEAAVLTYLQLLQPPDARLMKADKFAYTQVISVESTAFIEQGNTYLGWPTREGIVAVDPTVIPLGTHLYIEGYGYAVAADVGSGVKQQHVDVFLPSLQAALAYGRQKDTKVYLLD